MVRFEDEERDVLAALKAQEDATSTLELAAQDEESLELNPPTGSSRAAAVLDAAQG